jgi:hypothetical protein
MYKTLHQNKIKFGYNILSALQSTPLTSEKTSTIISVLRKKLLAPHPGDKLLYHTHLYRCSVTNLSYFSEVFLHRQATSKTFGYHVTYLCLEMIAAELAFITLQPLPCLNTCLVKAKTYSLHYKLKFIHYGITK